MFDLNLLQVNNKSSLEATNITVDGVSEHSSSVELDFNVTQTNYDACIEDNKLFNFDKFDKIVNESDSVVETCHRHSDKVNSLSSSVELQVNLPRCDFVADFHNKMTSELQSPVDNCPAESSNLSVHDNFCMSLINLDDVSNIHDDFCMQVLCDLEERQGKSSVEVTHVPQTSVYQTPEELDRNLQDFLNTAVCDEVHRRLRVRNVIYLCQ